MPAQKKLVNFLGKVFTLLALAFLFLKLREHINELPKSENPFNIILLLMLSSILWLLISLPGIYAWLLLLRGGKAMISFRDAYVIMGESQIGKYLPGNIFQYLGRAKIGGEYGISAEVSIVTMTLEAIILSLAALSLAVLGFAVWNQSLNINQLLGMGSSSIIIGLGCVLLIALLVLIISPKARGWIYERRSYLTFSRIIIVFLCYILFFLASGIIISWLAGTVWHNERLIEWYDYSSGFALAWLVGFVIPGVSGGLGVREAIFLALFGPVLGVAPAIGLAVIIRIVTLLSDVLQFLSAILLRKLSPPPTGL